jgi:hypothetical protein
MIRRAMDRREAIGLGLLLILAAAVRFIGLPGRGTWDADQGHDMLVLLDLVRHGTIPLLGPPTSIGDFHHGAIYYFLLAPAAFLSNADPTAVVAEIALAGVAAVGVTWWLARSIGGPVAGFAAALAMAVSSSAIDESTFIWNPNLIALSSAIALTGAWQARTTGRTRWWLVAAIGLLVTMQCHVLGVALLPPVAALWVQTVRSTPRGAARTRIVRAGLAGVAIILAGYLPLLVYELGHGFAETHAALAFIASGGTGVSVTLPVRLLFVGLRILAWPLAGLLTDGLVAGVVAGVVVAAGLARRAGRAPEPERSAARWLAATLLFGWIILTFGAAGLSTVSPLPVDHYHAFLDPVVFVALGLGVAAVWRASLVAARVSAIGALGALLAWNVWIWPPAVAADGGWPAGRAAGDRIGAVLAGRPATFASLPTFKSADTYRFPVERDHPGSTAPARTTGNAGATDGDAGVSPTPLLSGLVIVCDSLFVRDCGGPAEDAYLADPTTAPGRSFRLADRWLAAPRQTVSVYLPMP